MGVFGLFVPGRAPPGHERVEDRLFRIGTFAVAAVARAWQSLRDAERLLGLRAFEREARGVEGRREQARLAALVDATRQVLLAQSALLEQRETSAPTGNGVSAGGDPGLAQVLEDAADEVEGRGPGGRSARRTDLLRGPEQAESGDVGEQAEENIAAIEPGTGVARILAERVATLRRRAEGAAA